MLLLPLLLLLISLHALLLGLFGLLVHQPYLSVFLHCSFAVLSDLH